jgi:hypothetical protein
LADYLRIYGEIPIILRKIAYSPWDKVNYAEIVDLLKTLHDDFNKLQLKNSVPFEVQAEMFASVVFMKHTASCKHKRVIRRNKWLPKKSESKSKVTNTQL